MKITKPNITEGEWYQSIDLSRVLVNSEGIPVICVSRDNSLKAHERFANAKAISAVPDMIDALIEARETLLHINGHDAYGDFSEEITEIEKELTKAGCTYE